MKKNLFFNILLLTSISHIVVAMDNKFIIEKCEKKDNTSPINPIDTVNNEVPNIYPKIDKKSSLFDEKSNDSPEENNIPPKPPGYMDIWSNALVNACSNGVNTVSKLTGFKDITNESSDQINIIVENINSIRTLEDFKNDYKNHSIISNKSSFIQKVIARKNAFDTAIAVGILTIHNNGNSNIDELKKLNEKREVQKQLNQAFDNLIQSQISLLNEDFKHKSDKITKINTLDTKKDMQIIENNNNEDKDKTDK